MEKVVSNEQRLANRQNARHSTGPQTPTGTPRFPRTSRLNSTIDIRQSTIPAAPSPSFAVCVQCHTMTLHEKTVLAKRTHLKPIHEKGKYECVREKRFRLRLGWRRTLQMPQMPPAVDVEDGPGAEGEVAAGMRRDVGVAGRYLRGLHTRADAT
jgi:hypothetical protein